MRSLAISVLGAVMLIATIVVAAALSRMLDDDGVDPWFIGILFAGLWLYWVLGALIIVRTRGHIVGWLFAVAAAMTATVFACFAVSFILSESRPPDPLAPWVAFVGGQLFFPATILILPAVAIYFPTGSLPGPRWKLPVRIIGALVAVQMVAAMAQPGPMGDGPVNPLTPWLPTLAPGAVDVLLLLQTIGSLSLPLGTALGIAAIVVRFWRSEGDERQQLKWFLAATVPAAVLLPLSITGIVASLPLLDVLSVAMVSVIAIAVAVAILRHRLYDIDRFISRTISYGLVTALLVGVFLVVNLGLQSALSSFTSGNSLAVAGSTLLAAALFTPVRQRVQRIVDRRFDRARYDGERTASAFSVRMRDATDLPTVAHDLDVTVRRAIVPLSVGLWLRGSGR